MDIFGLVLLVAFSCLVVRSYVTFRRRKQPGALPIEIRPANGLGDALLEIQALYEPSAAHVIKARRQVDHGDDGERLDPDEDDNYRYVYDADGLHLSSDGKKTPTTEQLRAEQR